MNAKIDLLLVHLLKDAAIDLEGAMIDLTHSDEENDATSGAAGPSQSAKPGPVKPGPAGPPALVCGICWEPFDNADSMAMRMLCSHVMCFSCRHAFAKCPFGDGKNVPPQHDFRVCPSRGSYTDCRRCGKTRYAMFAVYECGHVFCKPCAARPRFVCDCGANGALAYRVIFP